MKWREKRVVTSWNLLRKEAIAKAAANKNPSESLTLLSFAQLRDAKVEAESDKESRYFPILGTFKVCALFGLDYWCSSAGLTLA